MLHCEEYDTIERRNKCVGLFREPKQNSDLYTLKVKVLVAQSCPIL